MATTITQSNSWQPENISPLLDNICQAGLLAFGALKARWALADSSYFTHHDLGPEYLADLLLALGLVARKTGTSVSFLEDGSIDFRKNGTSVRCIALATGKGMLRRSTIESKIRMAFNSKRGFVNCAIVANVPGGTKASIGPPDDILEGNSGEDIIAGPSALQLVDVDDLRNDPELANALIGSA